MLRKFPQSHPTSTVPLLIVAVVVVRQRQTDLRHVTCFILRHSPPDEWLAGPNSRAYLRNLAVDNLDIIVSWGISSHQAATHMMQ